MHFWADFVLDPKRQQRLASLQRNADSLSRYPAAVNENPITDDDRIRQANEFFARSLDGVQVLAYAHTILELRAALKHLGLTEDDVVIGVVESASDV